MLSGVVLALCFKLSEWSMNGIALLIQAHTAFPAKTALLSPPFLTLNWPDLASAGLRLLWAILFLLFVRYSPLSRYHGAEHQVVNALEQGVPLEVERVRRLSTVHPRCGTNLMVALATFSIIGRLLIGAAGTELFDGVFILGVIIVVLGWRSIGGAIQRNFTTRIPNPVQSQRAIDAAKELLDRYQSGEGQSPPEYLTYLDEVPHFGRYARALRALWIRGFPQVLIGSSLTVVVLMYIESLVPYIR